MTYITHSLRNTSAGAAVAFLVLSGLALAQDKPAPPPQPGTTAPATAPATGGWRHIGDQPPATPPQTAAPTVQQADPEPVDRSLQDPQSAQQPHATPPPYGVPAQLTLKPGTHTLQLLMGDAHHVPHNPPVYSRKITIYVK